MLQNRNIRPLRNILSMEFGDRAVKFIAPLAEVNEEVDERINGQKIATYNYHLYLLQMILTVINLSTVDPCRKFHTLYFFLL